MKREWIQRLEQFLEGNDFGKNWDGAYQDAVPTLRKYSTCSSVLRVKVPARVTLSAKRGAKRRYRISGRLLGGFVPARGSR